MHRSRIRDDRYGGKQRTFQNKTLRYPGHYQQLKVINLLDLLDQEPRQVEGVEISPRQVLHALWKPQIKADEDSRDLAILRILC